MQLRSRWTLAVVGALAVLAGVAAAVAQAQDGGGQASEAQTETTRAEPGQPPGALAGDLLAGVASHLGVEQSQLEEALKDTAEANIDWALANGFITESRANALKQELENEGRRPEGLHGLRFGGLAPGFGFALDPPGSLDAAAQYLGLSQSELHEALAAKTLAEVAQDRGKSVEGLGQALRDAQQARVDAAVQDGVITQEQASALSERFDARVEDLVQGRAPVLSDVAQKLGIEPSQLEAALEAALVDQVDAALAAGRLTQAQADALKARIRSGGGLPPRPLLGRGGCFDGLPGQGARFREHGTGAFGEMTPAVLA